MISGFSREIANLASRADSENENQDITPDTDTDSQEHLTKQPMMPPPPAPTSNSFKRAPVMGNRGLETRNSKRSSQRKTPLTPVNNASPNAQQTSNQTVVGALEVQNVKKAINRYGTLPKGARIGAYLESLRQNGEEGSPTSDVVANMNGNSHPPIVPNENIPSTHSPRAQLKVQPQMIRSNSSGGVTMTNNATASLNKLQRHRTTTDGSMMTTFSSFRSTGNNVNSPKRGPITALAELEFPPPPPPEEYDGSVVRPSQDVSNTAPSVEEASTRFGVSLRRREPSTDSCSSLGSPANDLNDSKTPFDVPKIDPASMLINELAETMNLVKPSTELSSVKSVAPKSKPPTPSVVTSNELNGIPFKTQLKKVDVFKMSKESAKDEITTSIIDFKSRLRKVDDFIQPNTSHDENRMKSDKVIEIKPNNIKKTEIRIETVDDKRKSGEGEGGKLSEGEDDKRKSTGSINSLKKLWEANAGEQNSQLSPKMVSKKNGENDDGQNNNNNSNSSSPGNGHHESGMDPPLAKKPAVPLKPSKLIYATPTQQQTSGVKAVENNNHSNLINASSNKPMPASRENILELLQMVECNLKIPVNLITATQWLQLSDKLNIIQSSCVTYADNESMPIHSKFQFKELVTRVENQSNCLRSAGQKNVQDNEKLLIEVGQSLKQLSNALHR